MFSTTPHGQVWPADQPLAIETCVAAQKCFQHEETAPSLSLLFPIVWNEETVAGADVAILDNKEAT